MIACGRCGVQVAADAGYCWKCGAQLDAQTRLVLSGPAASGPAAATSGAGKAMVVAIAVVGTVIVVLLLIAIAVPTFLGAQDRARDRGAQSDLLRALDAARVVASAHGGRFESTESTPVTAADLGAPATVGVAVISDSPEGPSGALRLWTTSDSGTAFGLQATGRGAVTYCQGDVAEVAPGAPCGGPRWP